MKKISLVILFCITSMYCFAQEIQWKVIKNTELYDENLKFITVVQKDIIVKARKTSIYQKLDHENVKYNYGSSVSFENRRYVINAEAVIPNETKELLPEAMLTPYQNMQGKNWFSIYYVEILKSKKRETFFRYNNKALNEHIDLMKNEEFLPIWWIFVNEAKKTKIFQVIIGLDNYINGANFYILDIKKNNENYQIQANCGYWGMSDSNVPQSLQPEKGDIVRLTIYLDGEYIDIYFEDKYLIGTYVAMDGEFEKQFKSLLKTNTCDLSNITFPRRADKTHNVGATCVVAESLRLRKEENTSSATLQIMQPGTQVQIRQLGKKDTIDGISANWVQVEASVSTSVQGTDVRRATGWCFGGYLVEK